MSQFPDPVPLPENVPKARKNRNSHLIRAARWGVLIRLIIIIIELLGVAHFGSSALLMDALASSLDIACSLILIVFIKLAAKPPDEDHPFGHGRYEPLAGLQLGVFMVLVGLGMAGQQLFQLMEDVPSSPIDSNVWLIPLAATLLLEACYHVISRVAIQQNSPALSADAAHYRMDALTSLFAAVTLIIAAWFPDWSVVIDHIGAIFIAVLMVAIGSFAARSNLHQLMDKVPSDNYFEVVKKAARAVDGVLETEKIRIQLYGPDAHVDIDVEVSPELPVDQAHRISQKVRRNIQKAWPAVREVTVHIEPFYPDDH
ncbi:cation diffusion facilitator family transporter [Waddlia chondrophila]|nr:cation diffusion facilitator family transporter [Waddlia chondrophila]